MMVETVKTKMTVNAAVISIASKCEVSVALCHFSSNIAGIGMMMVQVGWDSVICSGIEVPLFYAILTLHVLASLFQALILKDRLTGSMFTLRR